MFSDGVQINEEERESGLGVEERVREEGGEV